MEKTKEIQVNEEKVVKRTRKSTSYSLKAMKKHLTTIIEDNLTEREDREKFLEILNKWTEKFIKKDFGL